MLLDHRDNLDFSIRNFGIFSTEDFLISNSMCSLMLWRPYFMAAATILSICTTKVFGDLHELHL